MQFRNLGSQGPGISVLGVGAWAIGGPAGPFNWGPQDDDESTAALHRAFDAGVSWVDTAPIYGLGHSEQIVGQVVRERGEGVLVFTKCGRRWDAGQDSVVTDLRPASIRFELQQSLKRLGRDHVDLYQFHWPDTTTGTPVEESWTTMAELVQEGSVRWVGVSNFTVDLLERCERIRHVDSLQPPLSLLNRGALRDLLPWCEAHGTGVIAHSPLQSGLLSGAFDAEGAARLAEGDWRRHNPAFSEPRLSANLALTDRLRPIAERHGVEVAAVAVAWVLEQPAVTGAIVGVRRPSQLDAWLAAGSLRLDAHDLEEIAVAVKETGAGTD
jgi:aryl-alcohol dehydrogenase-like predicted oxidoreductase